MRIILILLFMALPLIGNAEGPDGPDMIPLREDDVDGRDHRHDISNTSFSAQLITNNLVKVQSTDITTFEVRILEAEDNTVCYVGSTTHGILHITTSSLSTGHYILSIKGDGFKYVGEFEIGN